MKKDTIFSDPTMLLYDELSFDKARAIALGSLSNDILTSHAFKKVAKKCNDYSKCISGLALLQAIEFTLTDVEKNIIELRFSLNNDFKTLLEIGNIYGVTDSAISRTQKRAIIKLAVSHQLFYIPSCIDAEGDEYQMIFLDNCDVLSVKAHNFLKRAGIYTINQFSALTQNEQLYVVRFDSQAVGQAQFQCALYDLPIYSKQRELQYPSI